MKRIMMLAIVLMFCFTFVSYGEGVRVDRFDSVEIERHGNWTVEEYVDDFGDPIGEECLKTVSEGTYSDSTSQESDLTAVLSLDPLCSAFLITLVDEDNAAVKFHSNDDIILKFKVDDVISEHHLSHVSLSEYFDYTDERTDIIVDEMTESADTPMVTAYAQLLEWLKEETDVRCVIYIGDSKYNFTISGDGYSESMDSYEDWLYGASYEDACDLIEECKYEEAIEVLEALHGYRDSEELIEECETAIMDQAYEAAVALQEAGNYEKAIGAYKKLDDYKDSKELIEQCEIAILDREYESAIALQEAGDYEGAIAAYEKLGGHKDSETKIQECEAAINSIAYEEANALKEAGQYADAISLFQALGSYEESEQMASECEELLNQEQYNFAIELLDSGAYQEAKDVFVELGDYSDSSEKAAECAEKLHEQGYSDALAKMDAGDYEGAMEAFQSLGKYLDAESMAETCANEIHYQEGLSLIEEKDYQQAHEVFSALGDYKDASTIAGRFLYVPYQVDSYGTYDFFYEFEYGENGLMTHAYINYKNDQPSDIYECDEAGKLISKKSPAFGNTRKNDVLGTYTYLPDETIVYQIENSSIETKYDKYGYATNEYLPNGYTYERDDHDNLISCSYPNNVSFNNIYQDEYLTEVREQLGNMTNYRVSTFYYTWIYCPEIENYEPVIWRNIRLVCGDIVWD